MTVLDRRALERACQSAGLLPTDLAHSVQLPPDTITAILRHGIGDRDVTLADLRRMATAVGLAPVHLLTGRPDDPQARDLTATLAAVLHRDGCATIGAIRTRLSISRDQLLDLIDAYNDRDPGLRIMRWDEHIGLGVNPMLELPARPPPAVTPGAAEVDALLWRVIDRAIPDDPPTDLLDRLKSMSREGLILEFEGSWRPTDHVIGALGLLQWDTLELELFARDGESS